VVLDWRDGVHPRVVATIGEAAPPQYRLVLRKQVARDRRIFPRVMGGIQLRYRALGGSEGPTQVAAWMAGEELPGPWHRPDPLMNFSVNGLRFEDIGVVAPGEVVLCEVAVGGAPERHRAVAHVMRRVPVQDEAFEPLAGGAVGPTPIVHHVALMFSESPAALREALGDYTLQLQRANLLAG
jgi:hypothetical protein